MRIKINLAVALALITEKWGDSVNAPSLLTYSMDYGDSIIVSHGCKVIARRQGAVIHYYLLGYAHDGSDTRAALSEVISIPLAA